ncbi:MAG: DUF192 domain-containing protein [Pseudomonadota bacterium]
MYFSNPTKSLIKICLCVWIVIFYSEEALALNTFTRDHISIQTSDGRVHDFEVELALTPEQHALGLMFRVYLAPHQGMLFDFFSSRPVTMWMKNTMIPLDMIFIRQDGSIESIIANAKPLSLTKRSSRGEVRAVLELAGGTTKRLNIQPEDTVLHNIFKR